MKVEINMRGLWGIGGTANTLGYKISIMYEGPWGIGDTANTTWVYEIRDKYEGPPGYWRHQYPLGMKVEINMRGL
jgi:hypothetical protein